MIDEPWECTNMSVPLIGRRDIRHNHPRLAFGPCGHPGHKWRYPAKQPAWKSFANHNQIRMRPDTLGINYLEICEQAGNEPSLVAKGSVK